VLTYRALGSNGRLGNQLWQVASTIGLAASIGKQARLPAWPYCDYFSFPGRFFNGPTGHESTEFASFIPEPARPYLQDRRCLSSITPVLRTWLKPSPLARKTLAPWVERLDPDSASAVHVRRGDYAETWRGHGMLEADFYLANWPKGRVLVFSDEPDWCRENLPGQVVHVGDWIDWHLMAMCREHLISNSTFAWWAAWASGGRTSYPTPWFTHLPVGDLFERNWKACPRHVGGSP
jgi:hypothetical protein